MSKVFVEFKSVTVVPSKFDVFCKLTFVVVSKVLVEFKSVTVVPSKFDVFDKEEFVMINEFLRVLISAVFVVNVSLLDKTAFHALYATVLTLVSLLMFCVNRSLSIQ